MRFKKPPRWIFKRYDDAKHWGLFIPVGRKVVKSLYDPSYDIVKPPAEVRMHWCLTVKRIWLVEMRMCEFRIRMGFQYL